MKNPMLDQDFLRQLDLYPHKNLWVKIISLDKNDYPIEEISGKIISGNVSVDGTSSVRRTCSLSMVTEQPSVNTMLWSVKTKFKLYVGVDNEIDSAFPWKSGVNYSKNERVKYKNIFYKSRHDDNHSIPENNADNWVEEYSDIIWFNEGIFIISTFSCAKGINSFSINLQGKDKMTMLNGELGGVIPASWDFGKETINKTDENGNTVYDSTGYAITETRQIPIKDIILQAVHEFTQEPWENIIVEDLDDYGIELLQYNGDTPFYYIIEYGASGVNDSREVVNMTMNGSMACQERMDTWEEGERKEGQWENTTLDKLERNGLCYEKLIEQLDPLGAVTESSSYLRAIIRFADVPDKTYTIAKVTNTNGLQVCGYRVCDIVYPYDLIASPGDSITSVLDKLVDMLGNFEYFYDVNGRFHFQKKRTYVDVSYNNLIHEHNINEETFAESSNYVSKYTYTFDNSVLLSSIQASPDLSNIKNDYSLWGKRDSSNGNNTFPIHLRYAIDHKPEWYRVIGYGEKDEHGEYVNSGQIYCTQSGWEKYRKSVVQYGFVDECRASYPPAFNDRKSALYDWWKLDDWGNLFEILSGQKIPDNLLMGYKRYDHSKTILDDTYLSYHIREFAVAVGCLCPVRDEYLTDVIEFDRSRDGKIITMGAHGKCTHTYKQLIDKEKAGTEVWVYDPRIHNPSLIREDSSSIWTAEIARLAVQKLSEEDVKKVDWREIIFQMANDYRRHYREKDFLDRVVKNNYVLTSSAPINEKEQFVARKGQAYTYAYYGYDSWYPKGYTGYEKYYIDFEMNTSQHVVAYWRELYNPDAKGQTGYYDNVGTFHQGKDTKTAHTQFTYNEEGWNPDILNDPEKLNFWFDFIDTTGSLSQYGVNNIGLRSKATNDDKIKSIYFRETPNVLFSAVDKADINKQWMKPGYCHVSIPPTLSDLFTISTRGKSAFDVLQDDLYNYTYPATSITLTSVPIYYLTPNTLIYVNDKDTNIVGEYILQKYSIQLGLNSQMAISAVETPRRIY